MAELAERLRLDLADPLAGDLEALADLLQGVLGAVPDPEPHLDDPVRYLPTLSRWRFGTTLQVRVVGDPGAAAPQVVDAVHALDPEPPVFDVTTLRASVAFASIFERLAATFVGAFGAVALALASLGIYRVIAYSTRQRTQEIAIRMRPCDGAEAWPSGRRALRP